MDSISPVNCPDLRQIIDFYLGKLDDEATEAVFAHLETCRSCESLMEQIEHKHSVPFVQKLRSMNLTIDREYLQESEFQQAIRNLPTMIERTLLPVKDCR